MTSTLRRKGTAAIWGIGLCAIAAQASALPPPPYAVAELAYSFIGLDASEVEDAGLEPTGRDRRATGYGITLGWRFSDHLGAEATFLDLGEARFNVADPGGGLVSNAKIGVQSYGMVISLAGTWPVNERLSLEGRAGAFIGKTETRASGFVTGNLGYSSLLGSESSAGLAAGLGAVAAFNDRWALRAGFDYIDGAFEKDSRRIAVGIRFNWP